jgi:hypothetical protein
MRRSVLVALTFVAAASPALAEPLLEDGVRIGAPITHANLTLMPLVGAAATAGEDYLVLDEGMKRRLVKVIERGTDGSVNQLVIENRARQPLFLMSGEVILGGKQDRIIGKDTVIPAGQRREVAVFCVEHGRWSGSDKSFRTANVMAHTKLRKKASFANQAEVWEEVSAKNRARGTANATDTYRRVATEQSVDRAIARYRAVLDEGLAARPDHDRIVGVAVALNGKVVAIEQFESPRLFAKVRGKLLRSYYVEAVDAPREAGAPPVTPEDVIAFATRPPTVAAETVVEEGGQKTQRVSGDDFDGTQVLDAASVHPAKPVYKSRHAK